MLHHPGIFIHTQARRDEILARDAEERLSTRSIISFSLDRDASGGWAYTALYSDFSTLTVQGPGTSRSVPALA